ncbi:ATP-binding protein [Saccharicrinis sp. FJH2]|uniref:ATP-binding protein n=1 Tax=Saccharicrinis sp. FJH65 TaxID=3344659 RepID=UPI0035F2D9AD
MPKKELLDLKFTISNQRIFEIFEGAALYDDAEFVFIREIVQNSIDATKIQIWKDISSGIYDFIIRPHLQTTYSHLKANSTFDIISNIKFPDDIPNDIYMNYPITLSIDWDENDNDKLNIICIDNGTGISEENLIRMTRKVGESRKNDKSFQDIKNSLPFWLRPTGAFGIGLQSLFILSDSFVIQTKADNEKPKEVIFRSAKKQNYCSITDNEPELKRGTRLILKIHKERFSKIFKNSFSFDIIDSYDYYTDKKGSIYLYKMQDYLLNELGNIEYLNINLLDEGSIKSAEQKSTTSELKLIASKLTTDFQEKLISYEKKESLPFIVYESNVIGSEIYLDFINSFDAIDLEYHQPHYKYLYFVRDIPVKDNTFGFYKSHYFGLIWNLLSPESDKVLSLSRNKLISKTKNALNGKLLYDVFPRIMPSIKSLFEDNFNSYNIPESNKSCIYFHILLSCIINENPAISIKKNMLSKLEIPSLLIESINNTRKEILATDFFDLKKLLVVSGNTFGVNNKQKFQIKQAIYNSIKEECKAENVEAIIWANQYFDVYLRWNYQVIKIFKKDESGSVFILEKNTTKEFKPVEVDENIKKQMLSGLVVRRYVSANRQNIYAIEPYCNILAVENTYKGGFEHFPYLSSHSILSPFKNKKQADEILEDLNKVNLTGDKLSDYVYKKHIDSLITDKIVENVLENRSIKNTEITETLIKKEYSILIVDFFNAIKDESPAPNNV